jgi:CRISPR-associated protein Csm3
MNLFDTLQKRIIIRGQLVTDTPLHIGGGEEVLDPTHTDASVLMDSKGHPVVPGSSLKGALRSRLESMLSNPEVQKAWGVRACNIMDPMTSCTKALSQQQTRSSEKGGREFAERVYETSCDVCRLFGNQLMGAHLQIRDMRWKSGSDMELRNGVGIDRETGTASSGIKYDYFVVPTDTRFEFEIVAENLDEKGESLLNLVVGMLSEGQVSLGGKTTRGLGKVHVEAIERSEMTPADLVRRYMR